MKERFQSFFIQGKEDDCWLWLGYCNERGYGKFKVAGRMEYAHIVACLLAGYVIPTGMTIDHTCLVKSCVNPKHLEVVTNRENNSRKNQVTSSSYTGVTRRKSSGNWQAQIKVNGQTCYLGNFHLETDAAMAYDKALIGLGLPPRNFPED